MFGLMVHRHGRTPRRREHSGTTTWLTSIAYRDAPDDTKLPGVVKTDYIRYYQKDYVCAFKRIPQLLTYSNLGYR